MSNFFTISKISEATIKEKASKFIGIAIPVKTEDELKEILVNYKKKYFDATHHCYAWVLGSDKKHFRTNDDGEPNHSAGDPILGAIKSKNLTNILVIVVRYYGGTKLGVGGLISAYKLAASSALNIADIVEDFDYVFVKISFDIEAMNEVMNLIKKYEISILNQDYQSQYEYNLKLKAENEYLFLEKLLKIPKLVLEK